MIANPYTRVCFRLGDQDARKLEDGFSFFDAKDLQNLGTGEAICRMERAEYDFNLQTAPLAPVDPELARERVERITQLSRQRYGTPREQVLAELAGGGGGSSVAEPKEPERPNPKPSVKEAAQAESRSGEPEMFGESRAAAKAEPSGPATEDEGESPSGGLGMREESTATAEAGPHATEAEDRSTISTPAEPPPASPPPSTPESASIAPDIPRMAPPKPSEPSKPLPPPKPPSVGRGGEAHEHLQQLIKLRALGMGWKADIEWQIPGGTEFVDLALERAGHRIACEFCVTSPVEQELHNIEKCLNAGIARIVSVCDDRKRLTKIQVAAEKKFPLKDLERVRFLTPDELLALLEELNAGFSAKSGRSRGYNVTESYTPLGKTEKKAKKKTLGDALVGSMDELREQEAKKKTKRKPKGDPPEPK